MLLKYASYIKTKEEKKFILLKCKLQRFNMNISNIRRLKAKLCN
jgi:hypothetical protein